MRKCTSYWVSGIAWRSNIARHPAEPQCVYDPVDGLALAPDTDPIEKIRMLEEEVCTYMSFCKADINALTMHSAKLKIQLQEQSNIVSPSHHNQAYHRPSSAPSSAGSGQASAIGSKPSLHSIKNVWSLRQDSSTPEQPVVDRGSADSVLELMYSGWNPDLPEPQILDH